MARRAARPEVYRLTPENLPRPMNNTMCSQNTMLTTTLNMAPTVQNAHALPLWVTFEPIPRSYLKGSDPIVHLGANKQPLRCPRCGAFASAYFDIQTTGAGEFDYTCSFCGQPFHVSDPNFSYTKMFLDDGAGTGSYQCLEYDCEEAVGGAAGAGGSFHSAAAHEVIPRQFEDLHPGGGAFSENRGEPGCACLVVDRSVLDKVADWLLRFVVTEEAASQEERAQPAGEERAAAEAEAGAAPAKLYNLQRADSSCSENEASTSVPSSDFEASCVAPSSVAPPLPDLTGFNSAAASAATPSTSATGGSRRIIPGTNDPNATQIIAGGHQEPPTISQHLGAEVLSTRNPHTIPASQTSSKEMNFGASDMDPDEASRKTASSGGPSRNGSCGSSKQGGLSSKTASKNSAGRDESLLYRNVRIALIVYDGENVYFLKRGGGAAGTPAAAAGTEQASSCPGPSAVGVSVCGATDAFSPCPGAVREKLCFTARELRNLLADSKTLATLFGAADDEDDVGSSSEGAFEVDLRPHAASSPILDGDQSEIYEQVLLPGEEEGAGRGLSRAERSAPFAFPGTVTTSSDREGITSPPKEPRRVRELYRNAWHHQVSESEPICRPDHVNTQIGFGPPAALVPPGIPQKQHHDVVALVPPSAITSCERASSGDNILHHGGGDEQPRVDVFFGQPRHEGTAELHCAPGVGRRSSFRSDTDAATINYRGGTSGTAGAQHSLNKPLRQVPPRPRHEGPLRSLSVLYAAADVVGETGGGPVLWLNNRVVADTLVDEEDRPESVRAGMKKLKQKFLGDNMVSLDVCDLSTSSALGRPETAGDGPLVWDPDDVALEGPLRELVEESGGRFFAEPDYNHFPCETEDELRSLGRITGDKMPILQPKLLDVSLSPEKRNASRRRGRTTAGKNCSNSPRKRRSIAQGRGPTSTPTREIEGVVQLEDATSAAPASQLRANQGSSCSPGMFEVHPEEAFLSDGNRYAFCRNSILMDPNWIENGERLDRQPGFCRNQIELPHTLASYSRRSGDLAHFPPEPHSTSAARAARTDRRRLPLSTGPPRSTSSTTSWSHNLHYRQKLCRRAMHVGLTLKYALAEFFYEWRFGFSRAVVKMRCSDNYDLEESVCHDVKADRDAFEVGKVGPSCTFGFRVAPTGRNIGEKTRTRKSSPGWKDNPRSPGKTMKQHENSQQGAEQRYFLNGGEVVVTPGHQRSSCPGESMPEQGPQGGSASSSKPINLNKYCQLQCVILYRDNWTGRRRLWWDQLLVPPYRLRVCSTALQCATGVRCLYERANLWPLMNVMLKTVDSGEKKKPLSPLFRAPEELLAERAFAAGVALGGASGSSCAGAGASLEGVPVGRELQQLVSASGWNVEAGGRSSASDLRRLQYHTRLCHQAATSAASSDVLSGSAAAVAGSLMMSSSALYGCSAAAGTTGTRKNRSAASSSAAAAATSTALSSGRICEPTAETLAEQCRGWVQTYFSLMEADLRFRPRHVYLPNNLRHLPLLTLCAKKRLHSVQNLCVRSRMSIAETCYFLYPRCFSPEQGAVPLSWRKLVVNNAEPILVLFDGQRMYILIEESFLTANQKAFGNGKGKNGTAVGGGAAGASATMFFGNNDKNVDEEQVHEEDNFHDDVDDESLVSRSAEEEDEQPPLNSLDEIMRRYLCFRKATGHHSSGNAGSSSAVYQTVTGRPAAGGGGAGKGVGSGGGNNRKSQTQEEPPASPSDSAWCSSVTYDRGDIDESNGRFVHKDFGAVGAHPGKGSPLDQCTGRTGSSYQAAEKRAEHGSGEQHAQTQAERSCSSASRGGRRRASTSGAYESPSRATSTTTAEEVRTTTPAHGQLQEAAESEEERPQRLDTLFIQPSARRKHEMRHHFVRRKEKLLSVLELQRVRTLAKAIADFLAEVRGEMNFYCCEIVFVHDRKDLFRRDAFGLKTHFLVEDETRTQESYTGFVHALYRKLCAGGGR